MKRNPELNTLQQLQALIESQHAIILRYEEDGQYTVEVPSEPVPTDDDAYYITLPTLERAVNFAYGEVNDVARYEIVVVERYTVQVEAHSLEEAQERAIADRYGQTPALKVDDWRIMEEDE